MLKISKISLIDPLSPEWRKERMGRFTASEIGKLMSAKSHLGEFSKGGLTYIQGVAGEIITKKEAKAEFFNDNVNHGNATEPEAIRHFEKKMGLAVLRDSANGDTHRMIIEDQYSAATPDGLVALAPLDRLFSEDGESMNVASLETKCPPVPHRFMKLYACLTPLDLEKAEKLYFWQVIGQMEFCGALRGYFAAYNPDYPEDQRMRVILFEKMKLLDHFRKMNMTLFHAKRKLEEILATFN